MEIRIESRQLGDVCVLAPQVFQDDRGFFTEVFRADLFKDLGLPTDFKQDNHSGSVRGVLGSNGGRDGSRGSVRGDG